MKTLLHLGGARQQIPSILKAKELGYRTVTCDYLPDNPGHAHADAFYNVSTTDKDAVLELASRLKIDGIVAYASDPAAPTAAYVAEKLGLPTSPFRSVEILSRKDLFRDFLRKHNFFTPRAGGYAEIAEVLKDLGMYRFPVMVKPVDSSGCKGINKVGGPNQLKAAVEEALKHSRAGRVVVEEFIEKKGYQISGDGFSVGGKLVFRSFANEFYSNGGVKEYVPLGEFWPCFLTEELQQKIHDELQRLITLLGMNTTAYNIEVMLDKNDNVFILELGARNGGSYIPQVIQLASGVDLVEYTIKAAMGEDCSDLGMGKESGYWSNYMIHSLKSGRLKEIWVEENFKRNNLVEIHSDFKAGAEVTAFEHTGHSLGTMIMKFKSKEEMLDKIESIHNHVRVLAD